MGLPLLIAASVIPIVVGINYCSYKMHGYEFSECDMKFHKTDQRIDSYFGYNKRLLKKLCPCADK